MNRRFLGMPVWTGLMLFGLIFWCVSGLVAQAVAVAEIDGVVTDQTGKVIPGAQVTATETDKQAVHQTTTDSEGRFFLPNLPVGPYRLEVKVQGFKDYRQT